MASWKAIPRKLDGRGARVRGDWRGGGGIVHYGIEEM